jgi:hypothetical protein
MGTEHDYLVTVFFRLSRLEIADDWNIFISDCIPYACFRMNRLDVQILGYIVLLCVGAKKKVKLSLYLAN